MSKRVYLTVDVGSNWLGDRELACQYVTQLAELEVDAVKFQIFRPEQIYPEDYIAKYNMKGVGMGWDDAVATRAAAEACGLDWYASVFSVGDVERLVKELRPKFIKIAARNAGDLGIVQMAAQQAVPTIISVSAQYRSMPKRGDYMRFFGSRSKYKLLHCVSKYPTEPKDVSLASCRAFDGLSDHTTGIGVPLAAAAAALETKEEYFLECHGIKDNQNPALSPDGVCSKRFSQIRELVKGLREVESLG